MEPSLKPPLQPWSNAKKIFFRFGFLFVVLFIFFKPNQSYTIGLYNFYIQPCLVSLYANSQQVLNSTIKIIVKVAAASDRITRFG